ncbi:MAG: ribonuclease PH [Candidatus Omnitrophica bacterium]|nr:ribonuclease PH [Candidatus Omnitrophota bacterium]
MRQDKRKISQIRKTVLKAGVNEFAEGSCLIQVGKTQVLCTASVEERVPPFMKGEGRGWVTAEYAMMPRSCKTRIPRDSGKGKVNGRSVEIQRLIGRSLRSVVNFEKLGERTIWIDCDVMQGDGGTRCASITGAFVALYQACQWLLKKKLITENPISDYLAAVSVGIVSGQAMADLCYLEDSNADVDMNLVMTGKGRFVELQGTAEQEPFTDKELSSMIALGRNAIKDLITLQKKALKIK